MFESFGFEEITARQASVVFALGLGLCFGFLAERTAFCFRRALVGADRRSAMGVWLTALATAIIATQFAVLQGWISFDEHRFLNSDLPVFAILAGGAMFGAGMVLTRGCVSRLTVLSGSGNMRALLVLAVFAIVAHATMKGVLAPVRNWAASATLDMGELRGFADLPGGALFWSALLAGGALFVALRSRNRASALIGGAAIGLLAALGWVGTGFVLFDDFDPVALESLSFTGPSADGLFFVIASSSIPAGFGPGLVGGVFLGSLSAALIFGRFEWQSFQSPRQTGRYLAGAALMGMGGALAGGCTVGAGLSGVPSLGFGAVLTLLAIAAGAVFTNRALSRSFAGSGAPSTIRPLQPAE